MRIQSCDLYGYALELVEPIQIGDCRLDTRKGWLLAVGDGKGHWGYGEASPLTGLHGESLETVRCQYQVIKAEMMGHLLPPALERLERGFDNWLKPYDLCPSLRYGMETAVLNLLARIRGCSLAALLASTYRDVIPINGLIAGGNEEQVECQAQSLQVQGYTTVKLKVGRQSVEQDIARVRAVRRALGEACQLRLDANRSWDLPAAIAFGKGVVDCAVEYIEEPLIDTKTISAFYDIMGIPVALDESLIGLKPATEVIPQGVTTLVLKPSVIGGLEKTSAWIRIADICSLTAVISSVFESAVGLSALANFAAASCPGDVPMGLDTYRWLGEDLSEERFKASEARISVEQADHDAQQLRWDRLHLLSNRVR